MPIYPSGGGGSGSGNSTAFLNAVTQGGADPTGVTDSSAAIQTLINDATLPIFFPPGNYRIKAGITLADGTRLFGPSFANGYGGVAVPSTRARLFLDAAATTPMITCGGSTVSHMAVEGLVLDGVGVAQHIIYFPASGSFHDYFSRVRGCYIVNIGAAVYGIYGGNNTGSIYIDECVIYQGTSTGGSGIYFSTSSGYVVNTLFNGFIGSGQAAAYDLGGYNNRYINCDFGVNAVGLIISSQETLVLGCFFDRNLGEAILVNSSGAQIIGCQFHSNSQSAANSAPDITLAPALSNIMIVGNYGGPLDGGITFTTSYLVYANGTTAPYMSGNTISPGSRGVGLTNYTGLQTAPVMPASTVALTNPFGLPCTVYVSGGTVTVIAVDGTTLGLISGAIQLGATDHIALTYSVAPTWVWVADHD